VNIPAGPSPVVRVYREDNDFIAAEHGSQYAMFCSPDTWDNPGGYLPLGFYISRVVADRNAREGKGIDFFDILVKFITAFWDEIKKEKFEGLAHDIFKAIAGDCGFGDNDKIMMKEFDHNPTDPTINDIADRYADIFCDWQGPSGAGLKVLDGLFYEILHLQGAAQRIYFSGNKARIVIFGHTHVPTIEGYHGEQLIQGFIHGIPSDYIYANTGAWVDSHPQCTYVETEENQEECKYYVRLYQYKRTKKGKKLIMDGFIPCKRANI
jgi:hypothetical protein